MSDETVPTVVLSDGGFTGIDPAPSILAAYRTADERGQPPIQEVKLGRRRPERMKAVPPLSLYFDPNRMGAAPPTKVDYYTKAKTSLDRMYVNDRKGCCVVTGKYHGAGITSAHDSPGTVVLGTDAEVERMYHTICGPGDNGCIVTDVLDYYRDRGLPYNGVNRKIDGYVSGNPRSKLEVQVGTYLFAAPTIAFMLPGDWPGKAVWDVSNAGIVGGHDVTICGYDEKGVYVSSWARVYLMTWAAFLSGRYIEELYYVLYPEWYGDDRLSPLGIDVTRLKADLAKLGGGVIPDLEPPQPTPTPPGPNPMPTMPKTFGISCRIDTPWVKDATGRQVASGAFSMAINSFAGGTGEVSPGLAMVPENMELPAMPDGLEAFASNDGVATDLRSAPWEIILLLIRYGPVVLPIIMDGIKAKKKWSQIILEVLAAIQPLR